MRVICNKKLGSDLPQHYYDWGFTEQTEFSLKLGIVYMVYAMCLLKNGILNYLIIGDEGQNPAWYPAILFRVTESSVPKCWQYAFWGANFENEVIAVWGYDELVNHEEHFDELSEMEHSALDVFNMRKEEIEAEA